MSLPNAGQSWCIPDELWEKVKSLLLPGKPLRPRNEEAQAVKRQVGFKARRWVVERTHSWMNRFRSVLIRWDKKVENYLWLAPSRLRFYYVSSRRPIEIGS